ncbi:NAD(P)-dependent oxidoreductase [Bordetella sp. BOR01]|uniref:NAD(P)-dependent oxidoreductase n=1 Tax=Bordetella sp. BOR01 TaxID=2854779 RepID=UPI001C45C2A8|nr:NAD(P)-dependent oxidoreductase [Bordetella sp. BOR01]
MALQKIGVIGLGLMGGNICRRLLNAATFDVTVTDVDPAKAQELAGCGARAAASVDEVVQSCDIVAISLPNPAIVKDALLKESTRIAMKKGLVILDFSTLDATTSKDVSAALAANDVLYVDTPVSGGPAEAVKGALTIIIGARKDELPTAMPVLNALGTSIHFADARGAGSTIKLVNNVISLGNVLIAAEALVLGAKAGVDGGTMFRILQHCGARSLSLVKRFPKALKGNFTPGFMVDLAEKDLALALDMAHKMKVPMMMASLSHDIYLTASKSGRGTLDTSAVLQYLEEMNGIEVRGETEVVVNA